MTFSINETDISFLALESPKSSQTIGLCAQLERQPQFEHIIKKAEKITERFPKLKCLLKEERKPHWETSPTYSLSDHLIKIEVENLEAQRKKAQEIFTTGLTLEKPLWRLAVISSKGKPEETSRVLFLVHHALCDGMSGIALFFNFCERINSVKTHTVRPLKRRSKWITTGIKEGISHLLKDGRTPQSPYFSNGELSAERRFLEVDTSYNQIKSLSRSFGVSSEVVLLLLSDLLLNKLTLNAGIKPSKEISLLFPLNRRFEQKFEDLGNALIGVRLTLPSTTASLSAKIEKIKSEVARIQTPSGYAGYEFLSKVTKYLPTSLRKSVIRLAAKRINLICTIAPAPKGEFALAGARVISSFGLPGLMPGQGVALSYMRYRDKLCSTLLFDPTRCEAITLDTAHYKIHMEQALSQLEKYASQNTREPNKDRQFA